MPEQEGRLSLDVKLNADVEERDVTIEIPEVSPFEFPSFEEDYESEEEVDFEEKSDMDFQDDFSSETDNAVSQ